MLLVVISLVGHHNHGLLAPTQDTSHLQIQIGQTIQHIYHKEDHVSLLNRNMYLLVDLLFEYIFRIDHPSTGINQGEFLASPFHFAILAVACRTRLLVDNRLTCTRQTVEQRGLSHVGPSNYCYNISHNPSFVLLLLI